MINSRHFFGLAIASFVTAFVFMVGGLVLQFSGTPNGTIFGLLSMPFLYVGVLASWLGRSTKHESDRLDCIEEALKSR